MHKRVLQTVTFLLGCLMFTSGIVGQVQAQAQVGGPYEVDEHTVLLLHFDGDGTNASDQSEDAQLFGNYSFLPNQSIPELGQVIYFKNDSELDSSRAIVPHSDALSLTGSFTIEGWVNIFTFSTEAGGHNWVSRLLNKPGVNVFYEANYFVELWGSTNYFSTGFFSPEAGSWPLVNTPNSFSESGRWYHITLIRDAERKLVVQMVHNEDRELVFLGSSTFEFDDIATSNAPLYIGDAGCSETGTSCEVRGWLDGAVDEVRISDVVRPFVPPFFQVTQLGNQSAGGDGYIIDATGYKLGGGTVTSAVLHYDTGAGYVDLPMTATGEGTFTATIPAQAAGTNVKYYVTGTSSDGLEGRTPLVPVGDNFYSFLVVPEDAQTLELTFEEGSGTPVDASEFAHEIKVWGANGATPVHSNDAAVGQYSLAFDSTIAFVPAPSLVLSNGQFSIDMWMNADTLVNEARLFIKQHSNPWWQPNYQIRVYPNNVIAAGTYHEGDTGWSDGTLQVDSIETHKWYHLLYVVTDDTSHFEVRDADDKLVGAVTMPYSGAPITANGPLTLGGVNTGSTDAPGIGWPFLGKLDNVKVYNYALPFTPAGEEPEEPVEPAQTLDLSFDEGSGAPVDASTFAHEVKFYGVNGDPTYSTDAAAGSHSLAFDSSLAFIEGPTLELASDEMTIDMWFNADTLINETRLFIKQHADPWWQPNYQIRFYDNNTVAAGSYHQNGSGWTDGILQIGNLQPHTWYHVFYVVTSDTAHFEIKDKDGNLVGSVTEAVTGEPIAANGTLTLGGVNTGTNGAPNIAWPFKGKLDEVKVYNYALPFTPTVAIEDDELPDQVKLEANYPNPFNPQTTIAYSLPQAMQVKLRVYDVLGRQVALLVDGMEVAGTHQVRFDGVGMASGLYFYQLETPDMSITRKMMLIK